MKVKKERGGGGIKIIFWSENSACNVVTYSIIIVPSNQSKIHIFWEKVPLGRSNYSLSKKEFRIWILNLFFWNKRTDRKGGCKNIYKKWEILSLESKGRRGGLMKGVIKNNNVKREGI